MKELINEAERMQRLAGIIKENYETNYNTNWNASIPIIGITKNQIRDIIEDTFDSVDPENVIFGTPGPGSITVSGNSVILNVELSNATKEDINNTIGLKIAKNLSKVSKVPIKFKEFKVEVTKKDQHKIEPNKIPKGTMAIETDVYIILTN